MRIWVRLAVSALCVGAALSLRALEKQTNQSANTIALRAEKNRGRIPTYDALIPSLDVKAEILRANPNVALQAEKLLKSIKLGEATSHSEFHTLFNYFYLLGDVDRIAQMLPAADPSHAIEHIDFGYLLTAMLLERSGLRYLALVAYRRYLKLARQLSLKNDLIGNRGFQKRLSVARIKVEFLQVAIPAARPAYYEASYLNRQLDRFFELTLARRSFLKRYVAANLALSKVNTAPLRQSLRGMTIADAPFCPVRAVLRARTTDRLSAFTHDRVTRRSLRGPSSQL